MLIGKDAVAGGRPSLDNAAKGVYPKLGPSSVEMRLAVAMWLIVGAAQLSHKLFSHGHPVSQCRWQTGGMKMISVSNRHSTSQVILRFGAAQLVRYPDGQHELIGGTTADHAAAHEWISLFAHDIVLASTRRTAPRSCRSWRKFRPFGGALTL